MSTVPNDVDVIRREMARIRRELHEDVRGVVATAEAATDWRRYLTLYPWVSLGAAFAVGYLIVPRRHRPPKGVATQADLSRVREAVETTRQSVVDAAKSAEEPAKRKRGLIGAALGILTPLALRAAQGYAMKYLEHWVLQQQMEHTAAGPPPYPSGPAGGPGAGRPSGPRRAGGAGTGAGPA